MFGIPLALYYPIFTLLILLLTIILVPKDQFKVLFWFGLLWGFLGSMVFVLITSDLLHLLAWRHILPFSFYGNSIWLNIAWILSIMLYLAFARALLIVKAN
jgi:hypothetical protein